MTTPSGLPPRPPDPGDVRDGRTLDRPPSARFQTDATADATGTGTGSGRPRLIGPGPAVGIAVSGGLASIVLNAVLSVTTGLIAVAALTGYLVGQALRGVSRAGGGSSGKSARTATAIGIALAMVLAVAGGAWLVAIPQGNVLGPIDYLGQTLGVVLPLSALAAVIAAWLGSRG